MNAGRRQLPGKAGQSPASSGLVMFRAGTLVPIQLPSPEEIVEPKKESAITGQADRRVDRTHEDARAAAAHNLRRAFPLPDSGSFHRLLEALEEA